MAEYIVQKPVDFKNLSPSAREGAKLKNWDITPKFDGCCLVLAFDPFGRFAGGFSATGEPVPSMAHIGEKIAEQRLWRGKCLVGEAWHPGKTFPEISGLFRRKKEPALDLMFCPFDAVGWKPGELYPHLSDERPYATRIEELAETRHIYPVSHTFGGIAEAERLAKAWVAVGGYDGSIIRDYQAPYRIGRAKTEAIKIKPVLSLDLVITRINFEKGAKTGRDVFTINVIKDGVETTVGSGMPHDLGEITVGCIAEIECLGITADKKLREPRFKGLRFDKVEAD